MKRELRAVSAELLHLEQRSNSIQFELEAIAAELRSREKAQEELTARQRGIPNARTSPPNTATNKCRATWRDWGWT